MSIINPAPKVPEARRPAPPIPAPLSLRHVDWQINTSGKEPLFCTDETGFTALNWNAEQTLLWIENATSSLKYAREVIGPPPEPAKPEAPKPADARPAPPAP